MTDKEAASGESLPEILKLFDAWWKKRRKQTWMENRYIGDGEEPGPLWGEAFRPHAMAAWQAGRQEQALQYLSDNGQWMEQVDALSSENARLLEASVDIGKQYHAAIQRENALRKERDALSDQVKRLQGIKWNQSPP